MVKTTTKPAEEVKTWLWLEELAAESGISIGTLRHWRLARTGGPRSFLIGRRIAYDRAEVAKWIAQQQSSR